MRLDKAKNTDACAQYRSSRVAGSNDQTLCHPRRISMTHALTDLADGVGGERNHWALPFSRGVM